MNRTLYLFFLPGCHACQKVKGALVAFERKHPGVRVIRQDVTGPWAHRIAPPESVPAFMLVTGREIRTLQGRPLTAKGIESWVFAR